MKVLMVGAGGEGAHARYCRTLAAAIRANGTVLDYFGAEPYPSPKYVKWALLRKVDRLVRATATARCVKARILASDADVIHFQVMTPIVDRWWLPLVCGSRPVVATVHNVVAHSRGFESHSAFLRPVYESMRQIIVHAEANRNRLAEMYPRIAQRIRVVPHGVWVPESIPATAEARAVLDLPANKPVLLFFGAIRRNKGLMTLIDAFARLRESGDASPVLVVAGALPNGGSFSDYQRRARQCGVEHSIRARLEFIPAAETAAYFAAADIVVLPYERSFEAQSGVLMEAYAYGRPVVVTNVGAIGDTVRRDGTGEVVEPGDPEAMAVALRRLLADASRRATAASNMKVLADEKYSWSRIARLIEDVYEEARES